MTWPSCHGRAARRPHVRLDADRRRCPAELPALAADTGSSCTGGPPRSTTPSRSRRERFLPAGPPDGAGRRAHRVRRPAGADGELGAAGTLVGTSSLIEAHLVNESIHLGSTLYGRRWWGTRVNPESKLPAPDATASRRAGTGG